MTTPSVSPTLDWPEAHRRLADLRAALDDKAVSPDASRETLRRRARLLAEPPVPSSKTAAIELLVFAVGAVRFGVDLDQAEAVVARDGLVAVPCVPAVICGIVNYRGQILAVVDLPRYFDLPAAEPGPSRGRLVVVAAGGHKLCLLADGAIDTARVPSDRVVSAAVLLLGEQAGALDGVTVDNVVLLDAEQLLRDPRITVNDDRN